MEIRIAEMKDAPALRVLYAQLEKDAVRWQPEHFVSGARDDMFFRNIFESPGQDILVTDDGGTAVGFVHVMIIKQKAVPCLKPQTAVYLQDLCVREDLRRRGLGTMLIRAAKDYGKENGADFIRTQVLSAKRRRAALLRAQRVLRDDEDSRVPDAGLKLRKKTTIRKDGSEEWRK